MAIRLDDFLSRLPPAEREAIEIRARELIEEEATLRGLREARTRSREQLAKQLGVNQAAVSKMERRTDMYISALPSLIEAMGGELDVIARFPDQPPVRITQFRSLKGEFVQKDQPASVKDRAKTS